jgi:hypothetical protein
MLHLLMLCSLTNNLQTGYSVGRVALLFALKPSREVSEPTLMAYVQRFSQIPVMPSGVSGFYGVKKASDRGAHRYEVIAASQIARPCPLSPQIKGPGIRGVDNSQSLDRYIEFYINKYRTPHDFLFLHSS